MDIVAQILAQEESFARQAIDAHAELNLAGVPAMDGKRRKLTLVERIRLIPAMAVEDERPNT